MAERRRGWAFGFGMALLMFLLTIAPSASAATGGTQLWAARYNGRGNNYDDASALGVSPDGSTVFVTGYAYGTYYEDYATLAYSASTGAQLWASLYDGPGPGGDDAASALGVSPDGSTVFVTGSSIGRSGFFDYATIAYSASTGAQLWASRYDGTGNSSDGARALRVSPDGSTIFVTGYSHGKGSSYDYATIAYSASTGARLWAKRYDGPGHAEDEGTALGVSPDGSMVAVTGFSTGTTTSYDYATVVYSASTGAKLWVKRYDGPSNSDDLAYALRVSPTDRRSSSPVRAPGRSAVTTTPPSPTPPPPVRDSGPAATTARGAVGTSPMPSG
jgi:hypothetical protein